MLKNMFLLTLILTINFSLARDNIFVFGNNNTNSTIQSSQESNNSKTTNINNALPILPPTTSEIKMADEAITTTKKEISKQKQVSVQKKLITGFDTITAGEIDFKSYKEFIKNMRRTNKINNLKIPLEYLGFYSWKNRKYVLIKNLKTAIIQELKIGNTILGFKVIKADENYLLLKKSYKKIYIPIKN